MTNIVYRGSADLIARSVLSSQIISGCDITIDPGNATFSISPGTLRFVTTDSATGDTTAEEAIFPGSSNIVPDIATGAIYVLVNRSLQVIQNFQVQDYADLDDEIQVGIVNINAGVIFQVFDNVSVSAVNIPGALYDLRSTLKPLKQRGLNIGPNGANLLVDLSEGRLLFLMSNYKVNPDDPNYVNFPNATFPSYIYLYRDGVGGFTTSVETEIKPNSWDDGSGSLANVGGSRASIQRLYISGDASFVFVHYGQTRYNNVNQAIQRIAADSLEKFPSIEDSLFLGYLIVRNNTTDLSNTSRAVFINAPTPAGEINVTI